MAEQSIEILNDPAALARASPDQLAEAIDRRNQLMDKIRDAAVSATYSEQWVDMDGKPWPTASAAETIARRCAVKVHGTSYKREERHDDKGDFYFYVFTATVELPGGLDSAEVVGTCSSRDQFLGTKTREGRDLSDINEDDILKAAYSNLTVNGVMRLLGLRGMTWDRLAAHGLSKDGAAKVEHRAGAKGGGQSRSSDDVELKFGRCKGKKLSEVTDDEVRYYVGLWEKDLGDPDKEKFHKYCKQNLEVAQRLLAARANEKAGVNAGSNGKAAAPSLWARIEALDSAKGVGVDDLKRIVKKATGKSSSGELAEEDIAKVSAGLAEFKKTTGVGADVPF